MSNPPSEVRVTSFSSSGSSFAVTFMVSGRTATHVGASRIRQLVLRHFGQSHRATRLHAVPRLRETHASATFVVSGVSNRPADDVRDEFERFADVAARLTDLDTTPSKASFARQCRAAARQDRRAAPIRWVRDAQLAWYQELSAAVQTHDIRVARRLARDKLRLIDKYFPDLDRDT